jgi:glycosyltransferase involved in cell wall biosynthesis
VRGLSEEPKIISNVGDNFPEEIILVEGKNPSFQRNSGVAQAVGSVIYFMDDDSILPSGLLKRAEEYFIQHSQTAVLGGPELTPEGDTMIQKSFGAVFASPFASGKSSARYKKSGKLRKAGEKELILCNLFVRKEVFDELKGFNEKLYPNEENEFINRVQERGLEIIYDPELFIFRSKRKDYQGFISQCFNYGRGRANQAIVNFSLNDMINFVPAFFIVYLISEVLFGGMGGFPFAMYLILDAFFSYKCLIVKKDPAMWAACFINFFILHMSYGAGSIFGLFTSFLNSGSSTDLEITVKKTGNIK